MPRISKQITTGSRISVSCHYLRRSKARELLKGKYDFNTLGLRFKGTVISTEVDTSGNLMCKVTIDPLPDHFTQSVWKFTQV